MTQEEAIRLQSYHDGELNVDDCAAVEKWLEACPEARAQLAEMQALSETLTPVEVPVPDVEAEWGKVRQSIEAPSNVLSFSRKLGAIAAVCVFGVVAWFTFNTDQTQGPADHSLAENVEMVETEIEGASPIVYIDEESGWTVVWVSEEAEPQPVG
ncbi:MAG: anti-sigma factor family protein [Opitutaceae bacterium]